MTILLGEIAHLRSGDKGNISQISVIAYRPEHYPSLARELTVERVIAHLPRLPVARGVRYEVPALGALNFVLEGALDGGVTRSLSLDTHGKSLASQLVDLPLFGDPAGDGS